jgi:hypothetical protein
MFGGTRAFDSGGYGESALREVLPVELDGKGTFHTSGNLRATLTGAGKAHPITRLLPDPKSNEEAWSKLPALTGLNQVRAVRGETLVSAAGDGASSTAPLLASAIRQRTFVGADERRRLALELYRRRRRNAAASSKLVQAVRWFAQEPAFEQVQLHPTHRLAWREKCARSKCQRRPHARQASYNRVFNAEGERISVGRSRGRRAAASTPTRRHLSRRSRSASAKAIGKDRSSFTAAYAYGEADDGRPRLDLLKQISESSKGEYFSIKDWNEKTLDKIAARLESIAPSEIVEQRQTRLWSNLWPFAIILVLLSIEWWMRRKWGLI